MTHRPALALFAALLFLGPPPLRAAEPPKDETKAEKLRKALDKVVDLDLAAETPQEAVDYFRDKLKLEVALDPTVVPMFAAPVKRTAAGLRLRDALRWAFSDLRLTPVVVEEALLLTTEDQAATRQVGQRVDVAADDVPLETALADLSRRTAVNVVLDRKAAKEAVAAKVTLQASDVSLETAARLLAEMAGLRTVRMDNVLFVTDRAKAKEIAEEQRAAAAPSSASAAATASPGGLGALGMGGGNLGMGGGILGGVTVPPPPPPRKANPGQSRLAPLHGPKNAARLAGPALFVALLGGQEAEQKKDDKKAGSVAARLFKPAQLSAITDPKTSIEDAVELIARTNDVTIEFNEEALKQAGLDPASTTLGDRSLKAMKNVTLDKVLTRVLSRAPNLTYLVRGDALEVTTRDAARAEIWGGGSGPYLPLVHATFAGRPLGEAFKELSEQSGLNIVIDGRAGDAANATVTAHLVNTPVDTAVRLLADMAELRPYLVDNVIYVTTKENADAWERRERMKDEAATPRVGFGPRGGGGAAPAAQ